MNKKTIPTLIGVVFLVLAVALGVVFINRSQILKTGASGETTPKDIRISNITDTSFTVSWVTDKATSGFISWGEGQELSSVAQDEISTQKSIHYITIRGLKANTTYFFKINSGGKEFDNSGIPWRIQTGVTLSPPTEPKVTTGIIQNQTGQPLGEGIVYLTIGGGSLLSAKISSTGSWIIPLSNARTNSASSYLKISGNTLLEIFVQGGPQGIATAKIYPNSANPTPTITLGQTHDFRSAQALESQEEPQANLELPEDSPDSSRFDLNLSDTEAQESQVTLESQDEGETIFTTDPEFFGKGPDGINLTIIVESEPIVDEVVVNQNGQWQWTPPTSLEEGVHQITLQWRDASGILRTLTRSFIVQAADGEPAFESTPSGQTPTPEPSASPSPTATPTATPTSTPIATASATPTPTPTPAPSIPPEATDSGLLDAGVEFPTIALILTGISLIGFGFYISKKRLA